MITGVILAKNEEKNIKRAINSLSFCNEIIVIDDYSTDRTADVARAYGAKVYKRRLEGDFAAQRNFGLAKAKNKWVFFLDADEEVSEALASEIFSFNDEVGSSAPFSILKRYDGFFAKRRDLFLGKNLRGGESGNIKLLRLGRKNRGKWKRRVHEYWDIKGKVGRLKNPILHYSHDGVAQFIDQINSFSLIHAGQNAELGKHATLFKVIFFPIFKFINNFIFRQGFRDGTHGFVAAMMMSFHSFLSWAGLYEEKNK